MGAGSSSYSRPKFMPRPPVRLRPQAVTTRRRHATMPLPPRVSISLSRPRFGFLIAIPLCVLLLASGTSFAGTARPTAAHRGGSITVLVAPALATWPTFDPTRTTFPELEADVYGQLIETGAHGTLHPDLATNWAFSKNDLTATLSIRHGLKFTDGTPLTAQVVLSNWQRDLTPANACQCRAQFTAVQSMVATGPYTIQVTLSRPYAPFFSEVASTALNFMVDLDALTKKGPQAYFQLPTGAGPFIMTTNVASTRTVLRRNPGYWEAGHPYLAGLTYIAAGSDASSLAAMQTGSAQVAEAVGTQSVLEQAKKEPSLSLISQPPTSVWYLKFDTRVPPFNNILAREAVTYATDAAAIDLHLFDNLYRLNQTASPAGALFYEPKVPGARTYDLAKARKLVKQLGGLSFSVMSGLQLQETEMLEAFDSTWKAAGIQTTSPNYVNLQSLLNNLTANSWQAWLGFIPGATDASTALVNYFSATGAFSGISDPTTGQLLTEAQTEVAPAKRAADMRAFYHYVLTEKQYAIWLFTNQTYLIASKKTHGLNTGTPNILWENVWLKA